ncbi:HAD family hydrolase [Pseudosulfitobacter sp. DSM 107133]|uniref:HAD family hydrolase n=1 Tax=Pseudosulfitobacter sp. DSM 107133 TaxID=2883100 RepID=UPI0019667C94|nr:HAD family hydrolase [Pseudosulfitobacter sp. DSM 107133]UOA26577.1 N-acetylmuramic acid 6-phosphate phosphatase [Pseudosulfitobacter sp. DSM 107133]
MNEIKGIIFDKDGTLFDFAATWEAWAKAFLMRACQGDPERATDVGHSIGFDLSEGRFSRDSIVIGGTVGEVAAVLAPQFPEHTESGLLDLLNDEAAKAPQAEAVPLAALLAALRARGLQLGVATNDAQAPTLVHLTGAGVVDYFDFIAGFDSGYGGKPAPGQLLAFCADRGLDPQSVVMVGDSTHDLHAGRAARMRTVAVLTGLADTATLAPLADAVLPDIGHLPAWLDAQALGLST